jgi:hypothetical protein
MPPPLGDSDDRNGVGASQGQQAGALHRVNGDIHRRGVTTTYGLTVVEHGSLILFTLTNHNDTVHLHGLEHRAHSIYRSLIAGFAIVQAHVVSCRQAAASVTRTNSIAKLRSGLLDIRVSRGEKITDYTYLIKAKPKGLSPNIF